MINYLHVFIIRLGSSFGWMTFCSPAYFNLLNLIQIYKHASKNKIYIVNIIIIICPGSSFGWTTSCSTSYFKPEITNCSTDTTHQWFVEVQELIQTINGLWREACFRNNWQMFQPSSTMLWSCDLSFIVNFS